MHVFESERLKLYRDVRLSNLAYDSFTSFTDGNQTLSLRNISLWSSCFTCSNSVERKTTCFPKTEKKKKKILFANLNKSSSQRHLWKLFLLLQNFISQHQAQSSDVTESLEWWADCVMTEGMESKERWRRRVWHAVWQSAAVLSPFSLLLSVCLQRLFLSIYMTSASSVSIFSLTFAFT